MESQKYQEIREALSQPELIGVCLRCQACFIEENEKLKGVIEKLVKEASFNACQPRS